MATKSTKQPEQVAPAPVEQVAPAPVPAPAPQPVYTQQPGQFPQQQAPVQYVVQQRSLEGIGGWLIFWLIIFGLNALSAITLIIIGIVILVSGSASVSGVATAIAIEYIVFGLLFAAASTMTVVYIAMRKKLGVLMAYISLGVSALYTTVLSITTMFTTTQSCSYGGYDHYNYTSYPLRSCETVGLPAGAIVALIGAILIAWLGAFLIALYFKMSKRVKLTLTN